MITVHNNKEDYTPAEAHELAQAYKALEVKAQGGELTLDETRIRIAYIRYKREENFKIAVKPAKAKAKPKAVTKRTPTTRVKRLEQMEDTIAKASKLLQAQFEGATLTPEEVAIVEAAMAKPPEL